MFISSIFTVCLNFFPPKVAFYSNLFKAARLAACSLSVSDTDLPTCWYGLVLQVQVFSSEHHLLPGSSWLPSPTPAPLPAGPGAAGAAEALFWLGQHWERGERQRMTSLWWSWPGGPFNCLLNKHLACWVGHGNMPTYCALSLWCFILLMFIYPCRSFTVVRINNKNNNYNDFEVAGIVCCWVEFIISQRFWFVFGQPSLSIINPSLLLPLRRRRRRQQRHLSVRRPTHRPISPWLLVASLRLLWVPLTSLGWQMSSWLKSF